MMTWTAGAVIEASRFAASMLPKACMTRKAWKACIIFERLPRGTHVFEYSLRAAHRGTASSGFASIRSRYAPEFSAHSGSVGLEVE